MRPVTPVATPFPTSASPDLALLPDKGEQPAAPTRWRAKDALWQLSGMRILQAVLMVLVLSLNYLLWFSPDQGVRKIRSLEAAVQAQMAENAILRERNHALQAEVKDLKEGLAAIEERARAELGMIRKDETFFWILEDTPASFGRTGGVIPNNPQH